MEQFIAHSGQVQAESDRYRMGQRSCAVLSVGVISLAWSWELIEWTPTDRAQEDNDRFGYFGKCKTGLMDGFSG